MICSKCKKEIPDGKVFCPYCGNEIRFVPDYNVFEEDYLSSMISEEAKAKKEKEREKEKKLLRKKYLLYAIPAVLVLIIIIIGWNMYFHSYKFYINKADQALKIKDYTSAINYGESALSKQKTAKAYYVIAKSEVELNKTKDAIKDLKSAIALNPKYEKAYKLLIDLYLANDDYDSISALKIKASDKSILKLFDNIVIGKISFSLKAGKYHDKKELKLSTNSDYDIYYTTDGNIPDRFNGTKFDKELPIELEEGKNVVKAALVDDEGRIGKVYTKKYEISFIKPEDPKINPESGRFTVPSQITILADGNCRLYYTWDGTDPTVDSPEYTGPINIPEGNNVLSVVAIDKYGMSSNVVRQNYIYEP